MTERFSGVYTIMPTPFRGDGGLDLESLERLTEFLIGLEVDGLVVLGVMGEAPKLSEREQEAVIATVVEVSAGRVPVIAGAGAAGSDLAVEKCLRALELGASGLLVAPPPVQRDDVIFEYYRRIDGVVDRPIILHDYPAATGITMSVRLVERLYAELSQVRVIKLEEAPSGPKVSALRGLGCGIGIVGGLGGMYFLEELRRGADGIMTGFAYPEVLKGIYRAYTRGDERGAAALFYRVCPLLRYEFQPGIGLALRKEGYRLRGAIASSHVRHPGVQIDEVLRRELTELIAECGLGELR